MKDKKKKQMNKIFITKHKFQIKCNDEIFKNNSHFEKVFDPILILLLKFIKLKSFIYLINKFSIKYYKYVTLNFFFII